MASFIKKLFHNRCGSLRNTPLPANINLEQRFIFVHIPKTAGTSIYHALGMNISHHKPLSHYKNLLDRDVFAQLTKFAFVRDPLERFISLYKYARLKVSYFHNNVNPDKALYGAHRDYELLKDASPLDCARYLVEGKLLHNAPDTIWLPQKRWLETDCGMSDINIIGRFENLPNDFANICNQAGIIDKLQSPLGTFNQSNQTAVKITDEVIDIVKNYYREDYDSFGYESSLAIQHQLSIESGNSGNSQSRCFSKA